MPPKRKIVDGSAEDALTPMRLKERRVTRNLKIQLINTRRASVINVVELMEHVLVHLPAIDIYNIRRVCKQWNTIVKTSTIIKEKLFLKLTAPLDKTENVVRGQTDVRTHFKYIGQERAVDRCLSRPVATVEKKQWRFPVLRSLYLQRVSPAPLTTARLNPLLRLFHEIDQNDI